MFIVDGFAQAFLVWSVVVVAIVVILIVLDKTNRH